MHLVAGELYTNTKVVAAGFPSDLYLSYNEASRLRLFVSHAGRVKMLSEPSNKKREFTLVGFELENNYLLVAYVGF